MSDRKRDPSMNITPDPDEIESFHRKRGQGRLSERIGDVPDVGSGGGGFMTGLLLLLILGLGGACYYLYDQLEWAQAQIKSDQQRIERMEKQLMITDESLDESASALEKKVQFLDSEVRKLWDNVWKRTKSDLEKHDKRLASLEQNLQGNKTQLAEIREQFKSDRQQLNSMQDKLASLANLESKVSANSKALEKLQGAGNLQSEIAKLEKRVATNEEWVESINAFRRQINGDISSLRETISQYHSSASSGASQPPAE